MACLRDDIWQNHGQIHIVDFDFYNMTVFNCCENSEDVLLILRWHIQAGNVVIPGSKNPDHIRANFDLFDFALDDTEMAEIALLDKNMRYYTSTPDKLKAYAEMVPPVDEQK